MSAQEITALVGATVAVLYGGGQIPSANIVLGKLIEWLISMNYIVYGIRKSYMGLADEEGYEKFILEKAQQIQSQLGTYLEMCRKVDPSSKEWFNRITELLKKFDIHTLFICGGDGSLRGATDFEAKCREIDFPMRIIFIPCTIDGINGSLSIGKNSAVAESIKRVEAMIVNSLATWDAGLIGPRVPIIELQGRNRNDILLSVCEWLAKKEYIGRYKVSDINIICLPAGYEWSYAKLMETIINAQKPSVIIVAEGAIPLEPWWEAISGEKVGHKLEKLINSIKVNGNPIKKANPDIVGYLSQTNDIISEQDIKRIDLWTLIAAQTLYLSDNGSKAIVDIGKGPEWIELQDLADKNPNSEETVPLSTEEWELIAPYLP